MKLEKLLRVIAEMGGQAYGVTIHEKTGWGFNTLHPLLQSAEEQGYIVSREGGFTTEKERYYTIVEKGKDYLREKSKLCLCGLNTSVSKKCPTHDNP